MSLYFALPEFQLRLLVCIGSWSRETVVIPYRFPGIRFMATNITVCGWLRRRLEPQGAPDGLTFVRSKTWFSCITECNRWPEPLRFPVII